MEAVLVMPSPDRGREFVLPLSMSEVSVRTVLQSGNQLLIELGREPADCVLLPEVLPDGPAEMWLAKAAAAAPQRPVAVVLVYGVEASESVRERVRAAYGPMVDVVAAGARSTEEVAGEAARVAHRIASTVADQDRDAFERLRREVAPGVVPQPVRKGGAIALLGVSGGVGTSTLVANLGAYAAMAGQRVLIVDAQFASAGSVLHYYGVTPDDHNFGIHHLKWGYMSATSGGAREIPAEELSPRLQDVRLRNVRHAELKVLQPPAILEHMANLPAEQVIWAVQQVERLFDVVLVDCGSGVGCARTQKLTAQASRLLLVAGGWGASVHGLVRALAAMEGKAEKERLFLLLREAAEGAFGTRTISAHASMPVYGRLPDEPLLRKADSRLGARLPVVVETPDSAYAKSVADLAFTLGLVGKVENRVQAGGERKGWFTLGSRK